MKGITTIIGMVVVFACLFAGIIILDGEIMDFLDPASAILVIVPTFAAVMSSFPMSVLSKIPGHFKVLLGQESSPSEYIDKIVSLAEKARKEGLLAFEKEQVDDALMAYALRMMVDGLDKFTVKFALEDCINGMKERHVEAIAIYNKAAAYAPAFGMCATVISLVNMLMGLDFEDPNAINALGANMATALITTLYGSAFANGIFLPIAARLQLLHKKEMFCKTMVCNGLLAILNGDNPRVIKDFLVEQLSAADAEGFKDDAKGGGGD
ncbi:MAG: MotA/TolQ/ExbB proton channel family protein [Oscillospiraceae bacterium]|nr:MotA/TolQ/ExbB proton channel family protein [Oscillospiraceae bacterium]MCL2279621.1 MotA/TolQ/ExbB proton channel family protein [Oscillospiraceae bacterium]